ncbi:MAG: hypothetical protein FWH22_01675 [Fibromonadales bacterium]|nr:hypothetical protein [Fibromonadales bacterium]
MSQISVDGIRLDNPAVNYNTGSVTLSWDSMASAEAYEIYAKSSFRFDAIYSFAGEVTAKTNGIVNTSFVLQTGNWFGNGNSAQILVAARNGKGKSAFGEPFCEKRRIFTMTGCIWARRATGAGSLGAIRSSPALNSSMLWAEGTTR